MVGICFYFESYDVDVWSGRQIDLDAWKYACKVSGDISDIIVIDKTYSNIKLPYLDYNCKIVHEMPSLDGKVFHLCCPWDNMEKSVSLWDFDHQVDWYVFGPASGWKTKIKNGLYVPQDGRAALHSVHVAPTVLFHRYFTLNVGK